MKTNRRDFLKLTGLVGVGLTGARITGCTATEEPFKLNQRQSFNMSGYAAPKLEIVRIGVIGLGGRGMEAIRRLRRIGGVNITAISDMEPNRINLALESLAKYSHKPATYSDGEDEWKKLCEREDVDLVYICTPWHLHTPMCLYAMENDKHAATEIPAAQRIDECWQLVETSERTRKHCMMLENCCYDFFEMITLNMVRQGFFGEIIHGEGAYIHDLIDLNFSKRLYNLWRLKENIGRDGNLYPMHGLGPIAQLMDINYGDKMDFMVSVSSNDFMMGERAGELAAEDDFWEQYMGRDYRGNMNTSIIKTSKGRTIMLQHDTSSPRPYSRIHLISGTKGIARKWPLPARIATSHRGWLSDDEFKSLEEKYTPEITKKVGEMARRVGGHGGMDTLMDWRLVDCLRNGLPLDMDVYDAALWSSIIPLSEWSVSNNSKPIKVPDFTSGSWQNNKPGMDILLEKGGNTSIL
jgi:hypothetical protein